MPLAVPAGEVGQSVLRDERALGVIDRVVGKRARRDEPAVGGAVRANDQLERRPRLRRPDVEVPSTAQRSRDGEADPAAHGLLEPDETVADLWRRPDDGELDCGKGDLAAVEVEPGTRDDAASVPAIVDDPTAVDLDPALELVGLSEAIGIPQLVEIVEHLGWRLVVMGDRDPDRELWQPVERSERQPGNRGDGRFDAHHAVAARRVDAGATSATRAARTSPSCSRSSGSTRRPSSSNRVWA